MKKNLLSKLKNKLFTRIIFIYSIITIVCLTCLSGFTIFMLKKDATENALDINSKVISNIQNIVDNKYLVSQNVLQQLYMKSDFSSSIYALLEMDSVNFFLYSLEHYMDTDVSLSNTIDQYLKFCFMQDQDIESIMLLSYNKDFLYVCTNSMKKNYYTTNSPIYQQLKDQLDTYPLTTRTILTNNINPLANDNHSYSSITDIKSPRSFNSIGKLIINFDTESIENTIKNNSSDLQQLILIMDERGSEIFNSSKSLKKPFNSIETEKLVEKSYMNKVKNQTNGLEYLGYIPKSSVKMSMSAAFIIVATIICCMGIISISYAIMSSYSKRINLVTSAIQRIQTGDLTTQIPIGKKRDEITQISQNINQMCYDLNTYIDKVYLSQVKQKNAELKALQAQINPHYLYNTLEAIRMRAIVKGATDVGDMIYILATFFKNSLESETLTTIEKEIEHCKLYLKLFKIRYGNILHIDLNIHESIKQYSIVRLSIQPIIENYIMHGIQLDRDDNVIQIIGFMEDNNINIIIKDNGCGIPNDKLLEIQSSLECNFKYKSSSIGLSNVNERFKIVYGNDYGLKVDSKIDEGTLITLKFQAQKKEAVKNV